MGPRHIVQKGLFWSVDFTLKEIDTQDSNTSRCEPKARFWARAWRPIPSLAASEGPARGANREALLAFTLRLLPPLGHFDPGPPSGGALNLSPTPCF